MRNAVTATLSRQGEVSASEPVGMNLTRMGIDALAGTKTYTSPSPGETARRIANSLGDYVGRTYTNPGAFKNTLNTNPGQMVMDAQALATIPEGGEGLAADIPGVTGRALRGAGAAARTFNTVTNPIGMTARAVGASARGLQSAIRGGSPLDRTGNWTPAARSAVQSAFPNGEIGDTELSNPKFKPVLAQTMQTKGINPAAAKEAVLAYNGAPPSRSIAGGVAPPSAAASTAAQTVAAGRRAIAGRVQAITGAASPDPSALGAALNNAADSAFSNAEGRYDALRQVLGSFGPALNGSALNTNIGDELDKIGVPSTPRLLARSSGAYPRANDALNLVNSSLVNGNTTLGGDITMPEIMQVRQQLTGLRRAAKGADSAAVGAITTGLHNHLADAASAGQFTADGVPNLNVAQNLTDANSAYENYWNTFGNKQGPSAAIANAVKSLEGSEKAGLVDTTAAQAAQQALTSKLASPSQGPAVHQLLTSALGGEGSPGAQTLDEYVRQSNIPIQPDGSALAVKPGGVQDFLNSPLGGVFNPQEQSDLRLAAAGDGLLTSRPLSGAGETVPGALGKLGRAAVGAGVGYGVAALTNHPALEAIAPLIGGVGESQGVEPIMNALKVARESAGAPTPGGMLGPIGGAAGVVGAGAHVSPALNALFSAAQPPVVTGGPTVAAPKPPPDFDISTLSAPPPVVDTGPSNAASASPHDFDISKLQAPPPVIDDTPAQANGGRVGRADGGKVGDEALVQHHLNRLLAAVKKAKSDETKATKPLLHTPDDAVAKALAVAQRGI